MTFETEELISWAVDIMISSFQDTKITFIKQ